VLVAAATSGIEQANSALSSRANDQGRLAVRAIDSLIARNVLALRIAANGALDGGGDPCERVSRALGAAPGTPVDLSPFRSAREPGFVRAGEPTTAAARPCWSPGQVRMWLAPERGRLFYKVGSSAAPPLARLTGNSFERHSALLGRGRPASALPMNAAKFRSVTMETMAAEAG
jgi:hypothetical protein